MDRGLVLTVNSPSHDILSLFEGENKERKTFMTAKN